MTATIIMFPLRAREALSAPEVGNMLSSALALPSPHSELERLLERAGHLLDNLDDAALDTWLSEVDAWEAEISG